MSESAISDQEFALFQRLIYKIAGISLSDSKKVLLVGRLQKRLRHYQLDSYSQYYRMLANGEHPEELQVMVDLLTTNETYFFREPKHFDFLRQHILRGWRGERPFRVWSAASSSGEEAYTIAMVLADTLASKAWEIVGSDISTQVLDKARQGHYPMTRIDGIPRPFLSKFCRKGVRSQEGTFLINAELRARVNFLQVNLTQPVTADVGLFDVIFLRNVMIYFDNDTKRRVVSHLLPHLRPGGHFIIGHSETLNGIVSSLRQVSPTIYRKE
ncbi:CheR family methyltransferase [Azonexus hydrophilus]|uniref:CheR family methyltransferase n=1 Tax=Azonexus hydrophilus TaxID=418702 RepID=UPI0019659B02|nr:protein-glutamate O-methyltransferase CheR [Azonexus hydrophilus]